MGKDLPGRTIMSSMPTITVTPSRRPSQGYSIDGETFTTVTLVPSRQSTDTKSQHDKSYPTIITSTIYPSNTKHQRQQSWSSWLTSKSKTSSPHRGWKPLSMTTPILLSLTLLTLLIALSIELLAQQSRLKGGLALSPSLSTMPNHAKWSYLYGPNIVAVVYSLLWSWVDLDVKRMQPWLELSKKEGARAEESLFLDYPFDFVAMAPWRAGRKGHWMVVLGGTAMMLVFWAVTPLQSAILGTGVVVTNYTVPIVGRSTLIPMEEQARTLRGQVSNQAFAIGWLNQSMPEYQTLKYAYAPFKPTEPGVILPGTNWTAETTRYWTDLTCWPAVEITNPSTAIDRPSHPMLNNGANCTYAGRIGSGDFPDAYTLGYTSFYKEFAPAQLSSEICPKDSDSVHQFLAGWKYPSESPVAPTGRNWTAIFCQPEYFKQRVSLTVDANTKRPFEHLVEELSDKDVLSDAEFNRTAFEYYISNGNTGVAGYDDRTIDGVYRGSHIDQRNRIQLNFNVSRYTNDNMIGYALALEDRPVQEIGSPEALYAMYSRAHKFMFTIAISNLSNYTTSTQLNDTMTVSVPRTGIVVSRAFAFATETVLILVAIMTGMLTWFNRNAVSKLQCNPSSIERLSDLLRGDASLVKLLREVDNRDDESLAEKLRSVHLVLESKEESWDGEAHLVIVSGGDNQGGGVDSKEEKGEHYYKPIRPLPLRKWSGLAFILCLVGAFATLTYFKILEVRNNGIPRPQASFETLQLLENVVPTIFATLTEPFWVLLTRNLCMLQPFHDLCKGKARAKTTIETTYLSVPPQIVMFRALKSRHFLLLSTCIMAFLGNFLAVGLGALFNEKSVNVYTEMTFKPKLGAKFNMAGIMDLHPAFTTLVGGVGEGPQITLANLSSGTAFPSWTTGEYFFQPFELPNQGKDQDPSTRYTLQARGFGGEGNCTDFGERHWAANTTIIIPPDQRNETGWVECPDLHDAYIYTMLDNYNWTIDTENERPMDTGRVAWESNLMWDFTSSNGPVCNYTQVAVFGRSDGINATDTTFDANFAICRPYFQTRLFNLTVDYKGLVYEATPVGEIERTLHYPDAAKHQKWLVNVATNQFGFQGQYHNGTHTEGWNVHLVSLLLGSRDFIDPQKPVPEISKLLPAMNEIYRRNFAATFSQYPQVFQQDTENATTEGQVIGHEIRIFMDTPALIISMVVLGLNLIVAVFVYAQMSSPILPRMPSSIGSLLAYIAPGSLMYEARNREKDLGGGKESCTYAFGRFVGEDGRAHVGIERDPYVVPIDVKSFKGKKATWTGFLRRRKGGVEHNGPWL